MSEIKIYGNIELEQFSDDDVTLDTINAALEQADKTEDLFVRINTFGGVVDVGFQIYSALRRFAKDNSVKIITRQDGYCASIGTVVFLAGDERIGNKWSEPFVHNAWTIAVGAAGEMQKVADDLERINDKIARFYTERTTITYEQAREYMNKDTFISAEDCMQMGFYTELEAFDGVYAHYNFNPFKKNRKEMKQDEVKQMIEESNKGLLNSLKAWFKKTAKIVNIILTNADGEQIEFPDVPEGVDPVVGDTAVLVAGGVPDGEVVMQDGSTYVFDNGTLTEIRVAEEEEEAAPIPEDAPADNALVNELKNLRAEIKDLKKQVKTLGVETLPEDAPNAQPTTKQARKLSEIRK